MKKINNFQLKGLHKQANVHAFANESTMEINTFASNEAEVKTKKQNVNSFKKRVLTLEYNKKLNPKNWKRKVILLSSSALKKTNVLSTIEDKDKIKSLKDPKGALTYVKKDGTTVEYKLCEKRVKRSILNKLSPIYSKIPVSYFYWLEPAPTSLKEEYYQLLSLNTLCGVNLNSAIFPKTSVELDTLLVNFGSLSFQGYLITSMSNDSEPKGEAEGCNDPKPARDGVLTYYHPERLLNLNSVIMDSPMLDLLTLLGSINCSLDTLFTHLSQPLHLLPLLEARIEKQKFSTTECISNNQNEINLKEGS